MYYYGGYQGYGCGNGYPVNNGYGAAIILVLFILLIVVIGTRSFNGSCSNNR